MCGRISQFRDPHSYTEPLGFADPLMLFDAADRRPGYNLAPGTHPLAIHADQTLRAIHWGYRPDWARDQHLPQTINARADAAHDAPYFSELWETGRVLVPADGWFEWRLEAAEEAGESQWANEAAGGTASRTTGKTTTRRISRTSRVIADGPANPPPAIETLGKEAAKPEAIRQPYFVHLKSDAPMYLAALSNVRGTVQQTEGMGLVIVTAPLGADQVTPLGV